MAILRHQPLEMLIFSAVTEKIFKIASMDAGAMLYEATREFEVMYTKDLLGTDGTKL